MMPEWIGKFAATISKALSKKPYLSAGFGFSVICLVAMNVLHWPIMGFIGALASLFMLAWMQRMSDREERTHALQKLAALRLTQFALAHSRPSQKRTRGVPSALGAEQAMHHLLNHGILPPEHVASEALSQQADKGGAHDVD